jgi:acetoin utilization deacetylase AcuC-like enzyme
MKTGLLLDDVFLDHCAAGRHPEQPERLVVIRRALERDSLWSACQHISARSATRAELARVHQASYLDTLERQIPGSRGHIDLDTFYSPGTWKAARMAAGGTVDLSTAVLDGSLQNGAAFVRPPGHHATPARSMGFCILNNVAVAAASALTQGADRVAIVDWDIHHGNGTQKAFYEDSRVLYISTHMYPYFPGSGHYTETGSGAGKNHNINLPVPPRSGFAEIAHVFKQIALKVLHQFRPDLILVSCGFDSHKNDPLGALELETVHFQTLNSWLLEAANEMCNGRMVLVLEGGYDLTTLAEASAMLVADLLSGDLPQEPVPSTPPTALVRRMTADVARLLSDTWQL